MKQLDEMSVMELKALKADQQDARDNAIEVIRAINMAHAIRMREEHRQGPKPPDREEAAAN